MAGPAPGPGFHPHLPSPAFRWAGKGLGAMMWFFIFYRARKDGAAKLLGNHSFMHEAHGHDNAHGGHH
ncbi:hypothetical protein BKA62DRAFT_766649 [Auriculariales sp. MPI-PUGE-AT-0066]|nr:hypothetical protein BKA62DRAFT_766649 [Auriculariales sp. MPI-PUGE-AT-0066]